jgi:hypothetical protein
LCVELHFTIVLVALPLLAALQYIYDRGGYTGEGAVLGRHKSHPTTLEGKRNLEKDKVINILHQ